MSSTQYNFKLGQDLARQGKGVGDLSGMSAADRNAKLAGHKAEQSSGSNK